MPADTIPQNSTIASIYPLLTHPQKYVRGVLAYMAKCQRDLGNANVRIGITGSGQKPYYRVFAVRDDNASTLFGSYYDNHDPLENGFAETRNWSTESMSFLELQDFFAEQIGYTGKRPR